MVYLIKFIYRLKLITQVQSSGFTVDIHSIRRGLWQEPDELLIYLQIETKYFRLMIRQYFISLTLNPSCRPAGRCEPCNFEPENLGSYEDLIFSHL